ncbi:hypothetical protein ACW0JT_23820 [Arthrobacter sp. SA17]
MTDSAVVVLHDGTTIPITVQGNGPALLVPARLEPYPAAEAETMRLWGGDPELGPNLVNGLAGSNRVIVADYEGHRMAHPAPQTLTPANLAADFIAIADAAGADVFGYYGYSWLALSGFQLAIRTERLRALAMGGFPPLDGPYKSMLAVTRAAHSASISQETSSQETDPAAAPPLEAEPGTGTPPEFKQIPPKPNNSLPSTKHSRTSTTPLLPSGGTCRGSLSRAGRTGLITDRSGEEFR